MRSRVWPEILVVLGLSACGGAKPDEARHVVTADVTPPPAKQTSSPPNGAAAAKPVNQGDLPMHLVGEIYSLIDLWKTDDGKVELRLGIDQGGGTLGHFRFVPLTGRKPDFEHETTELHFADTTSMGRQMLGGSRPDLLWHTVSGFRSGASDHAYQVLRDDAWVHHAAAESNGIAIDMMPWTKGRILQWRNPHPEPGMPARAPVLRVVRGADKEAPSIPRALDERLQAEGFYYDTLGVLASGEVVVIGRSQAPATLTVLVWKDQPKVPRVVTSIVEGVGEDSTVVILGGKSLAEMRVRADSRVLKVDGEKLVVESTFAEGQQPDVWFGEPLVLHGEKAAYARMAAKGPWLRIPTSAEPGGRWIVVDGSGVVWLADEQKLYASSPQAAAPFTVTEEELVARRKGSVRLGGSDDVTGEHPMLFPRSKCRLHYVLLDDSPQDKASPDYPAHRAALKGHVELGAAKLVISRERSRQYFGALVPDYETGRKLGDLVGKRIKGAGSVMCAEPAGAVEMRFDWATGKVAP